MEALKNKPKIALMSYSMDNRQAKGIALYTRKLIEGLLLDGRFDFYLVHYDKVPDPLYKKANEIIMPRVRLPYGSRFVSQLLFFWKHRKSHFDIVHWFQPRLYPFYWLVPAKRIIVTVHGAGDITAPSKFVFSRSVFNFILTHFHKWIDAVIVVSKNAKPEVIKHYGFSADQVISIYNGGGENYQPIKKTEAQELAARKYGIGGSYILDVSRLQPHKNIVALIKAYNIMRGKDSSRAEKLVIVGWPAYKGRQDEYLAAAKSPFAKDIIFIDFVEAEDLNAVYSASELFVFPSLDEGFGLPIIEAMASGVPVITSNISSMPEIGGKAVITINPFDVNELADAMSRALVDKNLREKMIGLGLRRAGEFTWNSMVEQTENLYSEIIVN